MIQYEKDAIVNPDVTQYLRNELKDVGGYAKTLEEYAHQNDVPIILPEAARFLINLIKLKNPKCVLEVGCAIGYSSILMAQNMCDEGHIMTLEYDEKMVEIARDNVKKAGFENKISVIEADAKDYLAYIDEDEKFDFIFLDGPKAHYVYMLDECVRLLKKDGVLLADNVLYKGMTSSNEFVQRRKITIVKRLRSFITDLTNHKELDTSILSIGDGMTFSIKKD